VPNTDAVLVPTGGTSGRLLVVSTVDGAYTEVPALTGVTSAAVSPDGRRVAVVAGGEVFVSSVVVNSNGVTVATAQRQLLAGRLTARAVTWTSESWLLVAGTSGSNQSLWRVGADGVLAEDLSGSLLGLSVQDLVCYPRWTGAPRWATRGFVDALAVTPAGVYSFRSRFDPEEGAVKPFFGT
jgi:hypothetical protein